MVWDFREAKRNPESCLYKAIISKNGTFERSPQTGRLIDSEKQLEVLAGVKAEKFCPSLLGFLIHGLPNAYLVTDHITRTKITFEFPKRAIRSLTSEVEEQLNAKFEQLSPLISNEETSDLMCVEDDCTNNTLQFAEGSLINRDINSRLAAIGFVWGKLKPVATRGPMLTFNGINSPPELQLGNGTIGQQFEYLVDRSIRVTNKTDICLNRFHPNTLLFTSCDTPFSTWTFHTHTHQLIEESSLSCLTHSGDGKVTLKKCESNGIALFLSNMGFYLRIQELE